MHKTVDDKLEIHDRRLGIHAERIDKLEQYQSRSEQKIENLCEQIKALVSTIKWAMAFAFTTLTAFFIWYIQGLGGLIK